MPKMTTVMAGKHEISIERALDMRNAGLKPDFRCPECREPVRPHKKGSTKQGAHFEHLVRAGCPLID
jgi:competence CoiA-like predicted nuclease